MPWETIHGSLRLHYGEYTEEDRAWVTKTACGAPQVAMRHPAHPAPLSQDKDQSRQQQQQEEQPHHQAPSEGL